ncbi:DUF4407 domain-containing protein [Thiospirillum jenense]|uniref:DUF4407 domain-containing protein n=1 Tax=Thiospirillum jenense TaxID=1653858 RepID=A0A839H938_9GAMM|nr:DUF4407 domain-containing protein [Thiospirillum jenense]MBB1125855.1 DUF4407 domain-containing protein [Thiospirillum jenense]
MSELKSPTAPVSITPPPAPNHHSWWRTWRQWPRQVQRFLHNAATRASATSAATFTALDPLLFRIPIADYIRLRPYGSSLATPAVIVWLAFAWVIITLMAGIEGIVWGFVGASIVPQNAALLRPFAGLFMFALMFAVIWIVDASLVMSERPTTRADHGYINSRKSAGAQFRWGFGLIMRVAIVSISLYVTAPFLAKLIRADDIASYHQRQVEQYYTRRDAELQVQIHQRTASIEQLFQERAAILESRIAQLTADLTAVRTQRASLNNEYAPELSVLRSELAAAQQRLGDELLGRNERLEGYGPEAQRWETRVNALTAQLAAKQKEINGRLNTVGTTAVANQEQQLQQLTTELSELRHNKQKRIDAVIAEITAQQPEALPPRLTFAARSKALQALRNSPDESGVPHFETVEGFAQAALGILFFALIALKLFEPAAVRAYFSEALQFQYRKYRQGGLADIPGFEPPQAPARWLNPIEFAQLWQRYEAAPEMFYADYGSLQRLREPVLTKRSDQAFEQTLQTQRQAHLAREAQVLNQRRELELAAYKSELELRTAQLRTKLDDELEIERERRQQALADELQRAREAWALEKLREDVSLREREQRFQRDLEKQRLRTHELEQQKDLRLAELRQAEIENQRRHEHELAEQQEKLTEKRLQQRLDRLHQEHTRLYEQVAIERKERDMNREILHRLVQDITAMTDQVKKLESQQDARYQRIETLRQLIANDSLAEPTTGLVSIWGRSDKTTDSAAVKLARRELKELEKTAAIDAAQIEQLHAEGRTLRAQRLAAEDALNDADARAVATETRLQLLTDTLDQLLI